MFTLDKYLEIAYDNSAKTYGTKLPLFFFIIWSPGVKVDHVTKFIRDKPGA